MVFAGLTQGSRPVNSLQRCPARRVGHRSARTIGCVAVVAGCAIVVALVLGVAIGWWVARRRALPAPPPAPPKPRSTLPDQLIEVLGHGVVVVDRDERVVLVNPTARAMGVLSGDHIAFDREEVSRGKTIVLRSGSVV